MELTKRQLLFLKGIRDYKPERGHASWDMHDIGETVSIGLDEVDQLVPELEENGYICKIANDVGLTEKGRMALNGSGK